MMKICFYEKKEILYFEGQKKADSVLPESAEKFAGNIFQVKAGKERKKAKNFGHRFSQTVGSDIQTEEFLYSGLKNESDSRNRKRPHLV